MFNRKKTILSCTAAIGLVAMSPVLVSAQDDMEVAPAEAGVDGDGEVTARPVNIEEITVTARKREESLQQTPVAITAFTATDIEDQDIRQIDEITSSVPSLQLDNATGGASQARIYLRGVGNGDPISSDDPGVGIYIDGVFLPRAQGALLTSADIQQIEVLRGPQGTLFGKNTIGGAISITSKKPDPSEFFGNASVRIGNYDRFDTRAAINVPLIPEKAAARFSFASATRDGFAKNKGPGRDFSDDKLLFGRAQLLMLPTDNLEINLSLDRSIENQAPIGGKCKVSNTLLSPNPAAGRNPGDPGVGEIAGGPDINGDGMVTPAPAAASFSGAAQLTGVSAESAGEILGVLQGNPLAQNNLLQACLQDDARDERSIASDLTSSKNNLETWGLNGTISYDFGEVTLKSITSWRRNETVTRIDNDYTVLDFAQASRNAGDATQDAYSQEFQLTGTGMGGKLNYVVGAYGFSEYINDRSFGGLSTSTVFPVGQGFTFDQNPNDGSFTTNQGLGANIVAPILGGGGSIADVNAALAPFGATFNQTCSGLSALPPGMGMIANCVSIQGAATRATLKVKNYGIAGYTQGTYDFTDQFSMTLGARITSERKRVFNLIEAENAGFVGSEARRAGETDFTFERSARFKDISPLVNFSYQLNDETLLYSTFSKGFKSGGFNGRANDPQLTNQIDDEKLTSYEVGFKTSFLDNRVVLNGAAYYSIYEDIQLTIPMGINNQASIAVLNAGEAEIKGGELEVRARVLPNLDLTGSLGVVNSKYTDFNDPGNSRAKDRRLLATPNYTGNVAAMYMLPLGGMGDMRLRTEWTHRGSSGTDVVDSDVLRKGKNGELDATISWAMADGVTEIVLFGNNLLDREFFENGVNLGDSLGIAYRFFNEPRTYGIEVRRAF